MILIDHIDYVQGQCGADGVAYFTDYPLVFRVIWTINILGELIAPVLLGHAVDGRSQSLWSPR